MSVIVEAPLAFSFNPETPRAHRMLLSTVRVGLHPGNLKRVIPIKYAQMVDDFNHHRIVITYFGISSLLLFLFIYFFTKCYLYFIQQSAINNLVFFEDLLF